MDLHFRTLDFGQVTVGSSNVRNLAVTNNLPQVVLVELVGLEGQSELAGTGPPAQVVPAGATAGFDVHFKCHTEQVMMRAAVAADAAAPAPSVSADRHFDRRESNTTRGGEGLVQSLHRVQKGLQLRTPRGRVGS